MYTSTTRTVLGEFSKQQYSLSPSYQAARLLVLAEMDILCKYSLNKNKIKLPRPMFFIEFQSMPLCNSCRCIFQVVSSDDQTNSIDIVVIEIFSFFSSKTDFIFEFLVKTYVYAGNFSLIQ